MSDMCVACIWYVCVRSVGQIDEERLQGERERPSWGGGLPEKGIRAKCGEQWYHVKLIGKTMFNLHRKSKNQKQTKIKNGEREKERERKIWSISKQQG